MNRNIPKVKKNSDVSNKEVNYMKKNKDEYFGRKNWIIKL